MATTKKPSAAEMKALRERVSQTAQTSFNVMMVKTLGAVATQQAQTVKVLQEISSQIKLTNKTLAAILAASSDMTVH